MEAQSSVGPVLGVSIDPGVRLIGWAAWADARLVGGGLSRTPAEKDLNGIGKLAMLHVRQLPPFAHEVVLEGMVIQHGRTKNPKDILDLANLGSFVAGHLRPERMFWTNGTKWKNDRPKEIQHRLDRMALFPDELATFDRIIGTLPPNIAHNFKDAVGIGLSHYRKARRNLRP